MLEVRDLPPLEPDQVYEVWLIGDDGYQRQQASSTSRRTSTPSSPTATSTRP